MMSKYKELTKRMNGNKAIIRIARKLLNRVLCGITTADRRLIEGVHAAESTNLLPKCKVGRVPEICKGYINGAEIRAGLDRNLSPDKKAFKGNR